MSVLLEVRRSELKFYTYLSPQVVLRVHEMFAFAVRERLLNRFYFKSQLTAYHSKKINNSLFISWGMAKIAEID